jgi:SPP1 gp7 family putative phage head morphogenesis protein
MAKVNPAEILRAFFDLPPAEAVAFVESKGLRVTWNWGEMLDEAHARAFTVAKASQLDVLQVIRQGVLDAVKSGKTLRQFNEELVPLLQQKGWWGKKVDVDPVTGEAQLYQAGSLHRLRTIYQTNLQSAYMAGQMQAQMAAKSFPYLQYEAVLDGKTRPSHRALDGQVFAKDDPVWATIYPPNGYNCRCRTRALTAGQMKREGLAPQSSEGRVVSRAVDAGMDKRSGELFPTTQTGVKVTGLDGKETVMWVDPGFNSSPLAGHWMDEVLAKKAVAALGDEDGFSVVSKAVLSPTRRKAWEGFVGNTLDFGRIQGQTMTVGVLPLAVALAMEGFSPVLYVPDRLIVGKKARRHGDSGDALSQEDWAGLPVSIQQGAEWFRDSTTGNLVAYHRNGLAVTFDPLGRADSAYFDQAAEEKVRRGQWVKVKQ